MAAAYVLHPDLNIVVGDAERRRHRWKGVVESEAAGVGQPRLKAAAAVARATTQRDREVRRQRHQRLVGSVKTLEEAHADLQWRENRKK